MPRWQTVAGVALGLLVGAAVLTLTGGGGGKPLPPPAGPILSECDGQLSELVIHYVPSAKASVVPVYRDFLGALASDVTVHVVCPNQTAFDELATALGDVKCRLAPVVVNHPITTWSRDRWVALAPASGGGATTLWSPRGEAAEEIWPARAGDERVGADLAAAMASSLRALRSNLYFDGGDFLADSENVFVVARALPRNIQHTVGSRDELLQMLACGLKRRVILLDKSPDHHAGMFMVSVGQHRMLVGDPDLGRRYVKSAGGDSAMADGFMGLPGGADFTRETQHLFDAVAAQCATAGYQVIRLPVIPACDGRTYLTYANVLIDQQAGERIVYLPYYRGAEPLNAAAREVWESLGYKVRPVDCTSVYRHFGCLHCLVNVLKRRDA
ncbi:MAG: hypothetical protein WCP45_07990 [Verrucomicrobiota bacterium]